mmetsp:Transcript_12846/g.36959  ORF Transcript_12846/g.36959 Transcript_12846/m.36959 type:complete len:214 (+) Transcript_12846:528-1169(+)
MSKASSTLATRRPATTRARSMGPSPRTGSRCTARWPRFRGSASLATTTTAAGAWTRAGRSKSGFPSSTTIGSCPRATTRGRCNTTATSPSTSSSIRTSSTPRSRGRRPSTTCARSSTTRRARSAPAMTAPRTSGIARVGSGGRTSGKRSGWSRRCVSPRPVGRSPSRISLAATTGAGTRACTITMAWTCWSQAIATSRSCGTWAARRRTSGSS